MSTPVTTTTTTATAMPAVVLGPPVSLYMSTATVYDDALRKEGLTTLGQMHYGRGDVVAIVEAFKNKAPIAATYRDRGDRFDDDCDPRVIQAVQRVVLALGITTEPVMERAMYCFGGYYPTLVGYRIVQLKQEDKTQPKQEGKT